MTNKKIYIILLLGSMFCIGLVTVLFALSEKTIHHENPFIRRVPPHTIAKTHDLDLGYNSYYIAGVDKDRIFLGNHSSPLHVLVLDSTLKDTSHIQLHVDRKDLPVYSMQVRVAPPYFYIMDGRSPFVFRGKTTDWKASLLMYQGAYFSSAEPVDSSTMIIRTRSSISKEDVLGRISMGDSVQVDLSHKLLQKQIDGIFCVDGKLLLAKELQKLVYVYTYRNQFVVANTHLEQEFIGKTIDTISRARIELASIDSKNATTLASRPLVVNKQCSTYGNYLFVSSNLLGRYDPSDMLNHAAIIDVYDLKKNTYEFSFYLYDHLQKRMTGFQVQGDRLIALMEKYIVSYTLRPDYFEKGENPVVATYPKVNLK